MSSSCLLIALNVEFINLIDVSLSKPDNNNFSNITIAVLLAFLAASPEPIPSLIASRYFPSSNFVCMLESPDIIDPFLVVLAIPICAVCLSSDTYVYIQEDVFKRIPHSCFCNIIFSSNTLDKILPIFLILQAGFSTFLQISVYKFTFFFPVSSSFIIIFCICISFSCNNNFISSFSLAKLSSLFISFAKVPIAFDTSSN